MREPTIRKQNIHRNHLKIRLIFFGILALALVSRKKKEAVSVKRI